MRLEDWLGEDNTLGKDIWMNKYCYEGETFDEWLNRVSSGNEEVRKLIEEKKFLFGGRILANRGLENKGRKVTFSNCYVIDAPSDSIEAIFDCAKKLARTYSYGGGCGVDISKLAPKGAKVNNAAKETSGATSFMTLYSQVTELIGQNGRRGALMISLDCSHPDVEDFIKLKTDLNAVTKANISVRISKEFMEAVKTDGDFTLSFKRKATGEVIERVVKAKELFNLIAKVNWDYAEPGALFWDRIKDWTLLSDEPSFEFAGTNPCAEEPLPAGGSCLLGSINLSEFVKNPFESDAEFDKEGFEKCVKIAIQGLNEVLEEGLPLHPLKEQRESVGDWRQVGLGIMGLADMLIKLGIKYGSEESIALCDQIAFSMIDNAIQTSAEIAKDEGTYKKFNMDNILKSAFFKTNTSQKTKNIVKKYGLRNSQLLTIAPTGTLSTMLGISGGIEPIYSISYQRKTESLHGEDVYYKVYTKIADDYMKKYGIEEEEDLPEFFVTAMTLEYHDRINMQSVWQKHIDASISSTVNVPNSFTVADTEGLYLYAYEKGLKGITIFRDGCKRIAVLTQPTKEEEEPLSRGEVVITDDSVIGLKRKLITGCGPMHCTAFFNDKTGELREVFLNRGSSGGCNNFMIGFSRLLSLSARAGVSLDDILDQLDSTGICPSYAVRSAKKHDTSKGSCCPMAVGNALRDMHEEMLSKINPEKEEKEPEKKKTIKKIKPSNMGIDTIGGICPECGEDLVFEGGCNICKNCGWSKCL